MPTEMIPEQAGTARLQPENVKKARYRNTGRYILLAMSLPFFVLVLLTWNCRHLAHGEIRMKLHRYNADNSLHEPMIVTPQELMRRDE